MSSKSRNKKTTHEAECVKFAPLVAGTYARHLSQSGVLKDCNEKHFMLQELKGTTLDENQIAQISFSWKWGRLLACDITGINKHVIWDVIGNPHGKWHSFILNK
jgi:hypothetical protein